MKLIITFILSCLLSSCIFNRHWKETVESNNWLYDLTFTGVYNLSADTINNNQILEIRRNWRTIDYKIALFQVKPNAIYFTQKAFKDINVINKKPLEKCYTSYNNLKYLVVLYKRRRDLNYLLNITKKRERALVVLSQHIYNQSGDLDSLEGIYGSKFLQSKSYYIKKLVHCSSSY